MLYFINKKANSESITEAISVALDGVSFIIPGGQATTLAKILNYTDKASSVLSLAGNLTKTDNKELSTVFNISSGVLGATNLVAFSGGKLINAATFDREIVRGTQYENVVRQLAEDVRANASEIAANSDAKNIQIRILDNEIALAQANNKSEIVNELQKAKKALESGSVNLENLLSKYINKKITKTQFDELLKDIEKRKDLQEVFKNSPEETIDAWLLFKKQNLPICK